MEALVVDVVEWAHAHERYIDAEIVGDLESLHAATSAPPELRALREGLERILLDEVTEGASLRLTCGWEDGAVVVRLLAREGADESLWEWVIGSA
jgi:hypothetical protein